MEAREVTVKQFIEAMRRNGYEHIKGEYIRFEPLESKNPVAGCAIGQAAINLGVYPEDLHTEFRRLSDFAEEAGKEKAPNIVSMNDNDGDSLNQIADVIEQWAKRSLVYTKSLGEMSKVNYDIRQ